MQDPSTAFQTLNPPPPPQFPEQEQLQCPRCDSPNTKFCYYNNYNLSQPRHFCKNCRRYWTKGGSLRNIPVGGGTRKTTKRSSSTKRANPDPDQSVDSTRPVHRQSQPSSSSSPPPAPPPATSSAMSVGIGDSGPAAQSGQAVTRLYGMELESDRKVLDMGGSFSTLLMSSGQFGNIFEGLSSNGSGLKMVEMGGFGEDLNSGLNASAGLADQGLDGQTVGSGGNSNNGSGGSEGYLQLQSGDWVNNNGWPDIAIYTPGSGFQ